MKKVFLCLLCIIILCGCKNNKASLESVNNKINTYFSSSTAEYDNLSFNYIDEENGDYDFDCPLYDKAFDIQKISKKLNIKIKY